MKLVVCVLALTVAVFASDSDEAAHVQNVLDTVAVHTHTNHRFSELEAAILNAVEAKSTTLEGAARSPMSEIAAMTDMMIIQVKDEIETMVKDYDQNHKEICVDRKTFLERAYGIAISERNANEVAYKASRVKWAKHAEKLMGYAKRRDELIEEAEREGALKAQAAAKRQQGIVKYTQTINEHDAALSDIKKIRSILQASELDGKRRQTKTIAATGKEAKGLLELRETAHPRLNNLILLAHKSTMQHKGMDLIYKLLYQTRDQLLESKNKVIKNEATTQSAYKRTVLSFLKDIGDLMVLSAQNDIAFAERLILVAEEKTKWAVFFCDYCKHRDAAFAAITEIDHIKEFCRKMVAEHSTLLATKNNEKEALLKVSALLVTMKWSSKVYNAIADVTQGVIYLHGKYNIRSALNRYMTAYKNGNKITARFDVAGAQHYAAALEFKLVSTDLSYHIIYTAKKGTKDELSYLTEVTDEKGATSIEFLRVVDNKKASNWELQYEAKSGRMYIKNKKSQNTLYVKKRANAYTVTTMQQSTDLHSEFFIERTTYSLSGCYKYKETDKLKLYAGSSENQNTESCYKSCLGMLNTNLLYFGLRSTNMCYCGPKDSSFSKEVAPLSECGFICPGRDGDLCGGQMRVIVHEVQAGKKKTIISRYSQDYCDKGYTTVGGPGADIKGCGIAGCDKTKTTQAGCAALCTANKDCHAYSWAPKKSDPSHLTTTVCTQYATTVPNTHLINKSVSKQQTFCVKASKA